MNTPSLPEEAGHLHSCLFGRTIDPVSRARYEAAHRHLPPMASQLVSRVVSRRLDVEAIEFALRRRGTGRELTQKVQILSYIAEVRPEYLAFYVNPTPSRVRAAAALLAALLNAGWKLLRGEYLIRRHGLL